MTTQCSLEDEVQAILESHFPAGQFPEVVDQAIANGDCQLITEEPTPISSETAPVAVSSLSV